MINYALLVISVAFLFTGIVKSIVSAKPSIVISSVLTSLLMCYSIFFLVVDYFTGNGIDESVIYQFSYGFEGAGFREYWQLIVIAVLGVVCSLLVPYMLLNKYSITSGQESGKHVLVFCLLSLFAFVFHPVTYNLYRLNTTEPPGNGREEVVVLKEIAVAGEEVLAQNESSVEGPSSVPVVRSIASYQEKFNNFYRRPNAQRTSKRKNLLYIYAESLERTYFNEDILPGLIKELRKLETMGTSFTNIQQVWGTTWTVAGLTASQCGIPLVTSSSENSMSGMDSFLANATCLGDLLARENYDLNYLSGSSVEYGGTGKLFTTHGFNKVAGREKLGELLVDKSYQTGWGLYDDTLLDITFDEFNALSTKGKPFGLFVSTMDTHHPNGVMSSKCKGIEYKKYQNPMLNSVACADYMLGDLVNKVLSSSYSEDTVIVISSDHLAMNNSAANILNRVDRRNLFLIIEPQKKGRKINKKGTMLDVAPTLLPFLGYKGELGLGRNLLGGEASLVSVINEFDGVIRSWKKRMINFWDFPKIDMDDKFFIDIQSKKLTVNDRVFNYPLLVELDDDNNSIFKFLFNASVSYLSLTYHVEKIGKGRPFLWIDACNSMRSKKNGDQNSTCVMYGRASEKGAVIKAVQTDMTIPAKELYNLPYDIRIADSRSDFVKDPNFAKRFIAHAGGDIDGRIYTNSREALDSNYRNGFRLFELDIIKTSDDHFVGAHHWEHWQKITGYQGKLPPTKKVFNQQKIYEKYTPLDMDDINNWFKSHPDAILVTDKVNTPLAFASQFVDKKRLIMELFSLAAVKEGIQANIMSAMPTWDILWQINGDKVTNLKQLGVTHIAASRRIINSNRALLEQLKASGIEVYVFNVNFDKGKDEIFVVCNEFGIVHGMYADRFDFEKKTDCGKPEAAFTGWL